MKLLTLLALSWCSIISVLSQTTQSNQQTFLARASAQLDRLAPYRRTTSSIQTSSEDQWQSMENLIRNQAMKKLSEQQAFEIYRMLPENLQQDIAIKVGGNKAMIELLANSKYLAMMQDRIKRSGSKRETYDGYESPPESYSHDSYGGYGPESYGDHYGEHPESSGSDSGSIIKGSTSLITGIANGIIGGLVSASGSASKGSSSISASSSQSSAQSSASSTAYNKPKPEYGPVYSYGDKAFNVWDFKKAIISTLMQAVKAISGGVIALKGQLLKGSGYIVAAKGKMITKAGDAVTNLGRNIAKNAAHPPPPPVHYHDYAYSHPHEGHEETYDGPPPGIEEYSEHNEEYHGNSHYESPSDVDDQAGLLIAKPTKPDDHDHHSVNLNIENSPSSQLKDNYHGPPPKLPDKNVKNSLTGGVNDYQHLNGISHNLETVHHQNRPPNSYEVPLQYHSSANYVGGTHDYPPYPPLTSGPSMSQHSPISIPHSPISIQQSVEYPPIHLQYSVPQTANLDSPHSETFGNDLLVYGSLSIDVDPAKESLKISAINQGTEFELPKFHDNAIPQSVPLYSNTQHALEEPLKIPLLTPYSQEFWQTPELPFSTFDPHRWYRRQSSTPKRRFASQMAQRMRPLRG